MNQTHRSCVRIRSSVTLTTAANAGIGNLISEENKEDHAETCGQGECDHDKDVIVVRTVNQDSVTMTGSVIGSSPQQQMTGT